MIDLKVDMVASTSPSTLQSNKILYSKLPEKPTYVVGRTANHIGHVDHHIFLLRLDLLLWLGDGWVTDIAKPRQCILIAVNINRG